MTEGGELTVGTGSGWIGSNLPGDGLERAETGFAATDPALPMLASTGADTGKALALPDDTASKQVGRWAPGQSGNPKGRPKGARSRMGESFLSKLAANWEENGERALTALATSDPATYIRIVAGLVPDGAGEPDLADFSYDQIAEMAQRARKERIFRLALDEAEGKQP